MTQKYGWRDAAVCLALALGVVAVYFPSFGYNFVSFEDQVYVTNNPHVNSGLAGVWGWAFQAGYAALWQPLTWISHALDCQMFGLRAGGHHATNVLLHALNSALVFLVLRQLTGAFWRCAAVAAFYAWHPLQVETVAWIAQRRGLLCAFFWLLALLSYARYAQNLKSQMPVAPQHGGGSNRKIFYALALLFFALALMSHPMAVTLPCVLLLLDWWPLGRLAAAGPPPEPTAARKAVSLLVEKVPFFVLSAASIVVSAVALNRAGGLVAAAQLSLKVRCETALLSCYRFVAETFWPSDLGAIYPIALRHTRWELLGAAAVLAVITILAYSARKDRPYWLAGWVWFLAALVPTMNLLQTGDQAMADRNMYLACIGLWMLVCWEASDLAARWRSGPMVLGALSVIALAACGTASFTQLRYWANEGTFLSRIREPGYNFVGHSDYAAYLMHHGQLAKAEAECQKAMNIVPSYASLPALQGEILLLEGQTDRSIEELHSALRLQPNLFPARMLLGRALMAKHRPEEAGNEFKEVLREMPRDVEAHNLLGQTLMLRHRTADAVGEFRASLALQTNQPETLNNLAWVLATDPHADIRHGAEAAQLAYRACVLSVAVQPVPKEKREGFLRVIETILAHGLQPAPRGASAVEGPEMSFVLKNCREPALLGTLAAALAETGDFGRAVMVAEGAHDLALKQGRKALAERNLSLLKLYREHKPFREETPAH
jgi:Flp pilus assembly protein TadD